MKTIAILIRFSLFFCFVFASGFPTLSAQTPQSTPAPLEADSQLTIGGTALPLLPVEDTGEVNVVAVGQRTNNSIPVVVRNDTEKIVTNVNVKAEARDTSGTLVGVGETPLGHDMKPTVLKPGHVSIGFILLDGDLPADATYGYKVSYDSEQNDRRTDVEMLEVNWLGDRIVGEFRNPGDRPISNTYLTFMCFSEDGTPLVADPAGVDEIVQSGESASFQVGEYTSGIEACGNFLIAGYGNYSN